ncbi:MAG: pentapeptide repeat-containing protein, partial [Nostoc sp.]
YYFRDLFSELYKSIPTENSEKNEQLLSEYNKYFNTIKENYLSIVEILEAKYLKPDNKDKQQKEAHQVWYINNSQFAGGLVNADTVNAHQIGGNITNYNSEQRQNLAEAAAEIQQLLNQLGQTYPTNTPLEKQIAVTEALKQIDSNPTLKARVIGALKAGETEAFKELVDNPLINILVATLEGWQDVE